MKTMKRGREPNDARPKGWKDSTNQVNLNVETGTKIKKFPRSPVKDLINSFELLAKKNLERDKNSRQKKTAGFHKPTSKKNESFSTKPAVRNSEKICNKMFLKPECSNKPTDEHTDIPTVKTGKFEEQNVKPNIPIGGKDKPPPARKVWTQLKSGLFGWKTLARPTIPSIGNKPRKIGTLAKTVTVFELV